MSPLMGRIMADLAAENTPADAAPGDKRRRSAPPKEQKRGQIRQVAHEETDGRSPCVSPVR
jgi:hypothetical protein